MRRGLHEARRSVVAIAPTASAVEELQKVGFGDAMTVARLLADAQQQAQLAGQVLIVDEAGMISSKDMDELIRLARDKGARILYSGDTAQIKSVSEGDALRVLERESKLNRVSLRQVQRQTNAEYRAAVEALRNHPAEGFSKLEAMGAIRRSGLAPARAGSQQRLPGSFCVPNLKGEARSVLVVAATHDEIKSVTYAIRQDRKRAGEMTEGERFTQHAPVNWTEAQKKQMKNYQPGQVLAFHKAVKGIAAKNESIEVVSATSMALRPAAPTGKPSTSPANQQGVRASSKSRKLRCLPATSCFCRPTGATRNFKATNGELVTVAAVDARNRSGCEDGRELPASYRQFTHGYAVTAHRSPGKTVDFEIIAAERMAQDLFYVSATRAREGLTVITSDSAGLQESIGISGDRQSASELARRAATCVHRRLR